MIVINHHQEPPRKKAYKYEFIATKTVEQAAIASGKPYEVTRTIVEMRDFGNPPQFDRSENQSPAAMSTTGSLCFRIMNFSTTFFDIGRWICATMWTKVTSIRLQ